MTALVAAVALVEVTDETWTHGTRHQRIINAIQEKSLFTFHKSPLHSSPKNLMHWSTLKLPLRVGYHHVVTHLDFDDSMPLLISEAYMRSQNSKDARIVTTLKSFNTQGWKGRPKESWHFPHEFFLVKWSIFKIASTMYSSLRSADMVYVFITSSVPSCFKLNVVSSVVRSSPPSFCLRRSDLVRSASSYSFSSTSSSTASSSLSSTPV